MTPQADVPRETLSRLEALAAAIKEEASHQNLIAASTFPEFWTRHIIDSLQLLPLASSGGAWLDIGSGAGFPGLVIALTSEAHALTLCEPRTLRANFLEQLIERFELQNTTVARCKVEMITGMTFDVISARAVASIERLFAMAQHLARRETTWLLPKGRSARDELDHARRSWQGDFRLVPSQTDSEAAILVATNVRRRAGR